MGNSIAVRSVESETCVMWLTFVITWQGRVLLLRYHGQVWDPCRCFLIVSGLFSPLFYKCFLGDKLLMCEIIYAC